MVKAFLRHYLPPYDPHAGGRELKVILQLYLLPYAIRLACRLLPRSPHAGGHAEVEAQTTHACLPPKVTIAGGHAKVKANLLPGCQPARSCSKPYALRLPNATEVPLAGGRVEVKAACSQSTSQRSRCTPQQALPPAYRGASKDPVAPACSLQCQSPPEDQGVAWLRQGTSPRSSLHRRPCPALDPSTARVTAQGPSVREERKNSL